MRKILVLALAVCMVASLAACGSGGNSELKAKIVTMCKDEGGKDDKCCECGADIILNELTDDEAAAMVKGFEMMEKMSSGNLSEDEMAKLMEEAEEIQKNMPMDKLDNLDDKIKEKCGEDCV